MTETNEATKVSVSVGRKVSAEHWGETFGSVDFHLSETRTVDPTVSPNLVRTILYGELEAELEQMIQAYILKMQPSALDEFFDEPYAGTPTPPPPKKTAPKAPSPVTVIGQKNTTPEEPEGYGHTPDDEPMEPDGLDFVQSPHNRQQLSGGKVGERTVTKHAAPKPSTSNAEGKPDANGFRPGDTLTSKEPVWYVRAPRSKDGEVWDGVEAIPTLQDGNPGKYPVKYAEVEKFSRSDRFGRKFFRPFIAVPEDKEDWERIIPLTEGVRVYWEVNPRSRESDTGQFYYYVNVLKVEAWDESDPAE